MVYKISPPGGQVKCNQNRMDQARVSRDLLASAIIIQDVAQILLEFGFWARAYDEEYGTSLMVIIKMIDASLSDDPGIGSALHRQFLFAVFVHVRNLCGPVRIITDRASFNQIHVPIRPSLSRVCTAQLNASSVGSNRSRNDARTSNKPDMKS